jgi:hypothetical protein
VTVDAYGRVTAASNGTVSLPATAATDGTVNLGTIRMCWGMASCAANTATTVTFPTAFSSSAYCVVANFGAALPNYGVTQGTVATKDYTASNFKIDNIEDTTQTIAWFAIGPA